MGDLAALVVFLFGGARAGNAHLLFVLVRKAAFSSAHIGCVGKYCKPPCLAFCCLVRRRLYSQCTFSNRALYCSVYTWLLTHFPFQQIIVCQRLLRSFLCFRHVVKYCRTFMQAIIRPFHSDCESEPKLQSSIVRALCWSWSLLYPGASDTHYQMSPCCDRDYIAFLDRCCHFPTIQ